MFTPSIFENKSKFYLYAKGVKLPGRRFFYISLWIVFVLSHVFYGWLSLWVPQKPLNDVSVVYASWMQSAGQGNIPGIHTAFIYPVLALLPMYLAAVLAFGGSYLLGWMTLVLLLNCVALGFILHFDTKGQGRVWNQPRQVQLMTGWWWCAFCVLLGPVAYGRIDGVTVPLVVVAFLLLSRFVRVCGLKGKSCARGESGADGRTLQKGRILQIGVIGVLLSLASWIKIWPVASFWPALAFLRRGKDRFFFALVWVLFSCVVVVLGLLLSGGGTSVLSFLAGQNNRGLQVESVAAGFFALLMSFGLPYEVLFDFQILTQQIWGPGVREVTGFLGILMIIFVVFLAFRIIRQMRVAPISAADFAIFSLSFVLVLIVFNKVGSPQFMLWLAAPVILGLLVSWRVFVPISFICLAVAALTHLIYPWFYWQVVFGLFAGTVPLFLRNMLLLLLLLWCLQKTVQITNLKPGNAGRLEGGLKESGLKESERSESNMPESRLEKSSTSESKPQKYIHRNIES